MSDPRFEPERLLRRPRTFSELKAALGVSHNIYVSRYMARYRDVAREIELNGNKLYYVKGYPDNLGDKKRPQDFYMFIQLVMQNWMRDAPARPSRETWLDASAKFHRLAQRAQEYAEYCDSKVEPVVETDETYEAAD